LYADIAHPINSLCREMIQDVVVTEYFEEIERAKQPGYISRYDDFECEYSDAPRSRPARFDSPHVHGADPPHARVSAKEPVVADGPGKPHFRRDSAGDSRGAASGQPPAAGDSFGAGIFSE
jgi:stage V sporulation protein G